MENPWIIKQPSEIKDGHREFWWLIKYSSRTQWPLKVTESYMISSAESGLHYRVQLTNVDPQLIPKGLRHVFCFVLFLFLFLFLFFFWEVWAGNSC